MSRLKILQYGHPLLREKAFDVKQLGTREKDLIEAMADTMYGANGVGLAATQVGVMDRIFVLDVEQLQGKDAEDQVQSRRLQVFINPEIVWESEEDAPYEEGCLSIPELHRDVYRPETIKVIARDENFEQFEMEADDLLGRVIQHELDHLNGILFIDHLSKLSRAMVAGDLNRIKRAAQDELDKLEEQYPVYV